MSLYSLFNINVANSICVFVHTAHTRLPVSIAGLVHFVLPLFRVLILVPLFFALITPRITYTAINEDGIEDVPTDASLLLPPSEAHASALSPNAAAETSKYGTFRSNTSRGNTTASGVTTRAHTPDPSGRVPPLKVRRVSQR